MFNQVNEVGRTYFWRVFQLVDPWGRVKKQSRFCHLKQFFVSKTITTALCAALVVSSVLHAEEPNYSYITAGVGYSRLSDSPDAKYVSFSSSYEIADPFHLYCGGSISSLGEDDAFDDINVHATTRGGGAGAGVKFNIIDGYAVHIRGGYIVAERRIKLGNSDIELTESDNGLALEIGSRTVLTNEWQFEASVTYAEIRDIDSHSFLAAIERWVNDETTVRLGMSIDDDSNKSVELSFRYYFGN